MEVFVPIATLKELVDAGFHFGHRVSRWNPKMKPYIYGKRNLIHIIDLRETIRGLVIAKKFLAKICATGKEVLFVGTKRQARAAVEREAVRCGVHYVSERWLGGTLTNFSTIRRRLERLNQLEREETDGTLAQESKKVQSTRMREKRKLETDMRGIRGMSNLPGALIVIDPRREKIAIAEARKLEIPAIALADTDCDPDRVDIIIPGNDDAIRAIEIVCTRLADAIAEGRAIAPKIAPRPEMAEAASRPQGRGRRPRPFRESGPRAGGAKAGLPPATEGGGGRGGRGRRRPEAPAPRAPGAAAPAAAPAAPAPAPGPAETKPVEPAPAPSAPAQPAAPATEKQEKV